MENKTEGVRNQLIKFIDGEFGLRNTFWISLIFIWGINTGVLFFENISWVAVIVFLMVFVQPLMLFAIWRAADKYTGSQSYAFLSKLYVVISSFFVALNYFTLFTLSESGF